MTKLQQFVKNTGLVVWGGKKPEQMTDDECRAFLAFMARRGLYYC